MPGRIEQLEEKYGECLAEIARLNRKLNDEIEERKEEMQALAKHRGEQGSQTHISVRPLGLSVTLKNVAPWALVLIVSLAALIIALVKR